MDSDLKKFNMFKIILVLLLFIPIASLGQFSNDSNFRWLQYEKTIFRQDKPFIFADTLYKCKILTGTTTLSIINGYCLCERKEQDFSIPPFGVDGWSAIKMWDRNFKIVRVKVYQNSSKVVIPDNNVWGCKITNW